MFKIIKVTGESLSPTYQEGDYVLLGTISFLFDIKPGDTIAFQHPVYGTMIKKVTRVLNRGDWYEVHGSHPDSVDSHVFGPIPQDTVVGKVLWHIS